MSHDQLAAAVDLARRVRFSGDHDRTASVDASLDASHIRYHYYERGLHVTAAITPGLFAVLESVTTRLRLGSEAVSAFVFAAPEIQASCCIGDQNDCLITISSGLVELLSDPEMAFVLGHEIGHFLLGHGAHDSATAESIEGLMQQRAAEISADRVGMIAAGDQDAVFRALIKTQCGLDGSHLRFDIGAYLDQLRRAATSTGQPSTQTTHPSLVFRCRALLRFEMSQDYRSLIGDTTGEPLDLIDRQLARDLKRFIDGPALQRITDARESFRLWVVTLAAVRDGRLDSADQDVLTAELGSDVSRKVIAFLSGYERRIEVESIVREKLNEAAAFYASIAPEGFATERAEIADRVGVLFAQKDFSEFMMQFVSSSTE